MGPPARSQEDPTLVACLSCDSAWTITNHFCEGCLISQLATSECGSCLLVCFSGEYLLNFSLFFQKSRKQDGQETNLNLNSSHRATTLIEHKVSSGFVVQDAVRNVTMKPETTRRQDDVTGRLPRYTSPRMAKSCGGNSAFTNPRNASQKVSNTDAFLITV